MDPNEGLGQRADVSTPLSEWYQDGAIIELPLLGFVSQLFYSSTLKIV